MTAMGEPFSVRFAMVLTIREGHIVHSRDWADPIAGTQLLGELPELVAALSWSRRGVRPDALAQENPVRIAVLYVLKSDVRGRL